MWERKKKKPSEHMRSTSAVSRALCWIDGFLLSEWVRKLCQLIHFHRRRRLLICIRYSRQCFSEIRDSTGSVWRFGELICQFIWSADWTWRRQIIDRVSTGKQSGSDQLNNPKRNRFLFESTFFNILGRVQNENDKLLAPIKSRRDLVRVGKSSHFLRRRKLLSFLTFQLGFNESIRTWNGAWERSETCDLHHYHSFLASHISCFFFSSPL